MNSKEMNETIDTIIKTIADIGYTNLYEVTFAITGKAQFEHYLEPVEENFTGYITIGFDTDYTYYSDITIFPEDHILFDTISIDNTNEDLGIVLKKLSEDISEICEEIQIAEVKNYERPVDNIQ